MMNSRVPPVMMFIFYLFFCVAVGVAVCVLLAYIDEQHSIQEE